MLAQVDAADDVAFALVIDSAAGAALGLGASRGEQGDSQYA